MRSAAQIAARVILLRAIVVWGMTRLTGAALPVMVGQGFGSMPPSPFGLVLLCGIVGLIDVRLRGERMLWANLGVTPQTLYAIYAAAAVPGEFVLAIALR